MKTLTLKVEGRFPPGTIPDTIRVEPEKGTYVLAQGDTTLTDGQLPHLKQKR